MLKLSFCVDQFEASTFPQGTPLPLGSPLSRGPLPSDDPLPSRATPFHLVFKLLKISAFKFPPFFPPPHRNNYVQMPHLIFL